MNLKVLRDFGYKLTEVGDRLDFSKTKLQTWRQQAKYDERDPERKLNEVDLADVGLDVVVKEEHGKSPASGAVMMVGALRARGMCLTRDRVENSLKRVDPAGNERRENAVKRKRKNIDVKEARKLVSGDGHEKLPWGIYIYGFVCVATRRIRMMQVTDTKDSRLLLHYFRKMCDTHGVPVCIRLDRGIEFTAIIRYMLCRRGAQNLDADDENDFVAACQQYDDEDDQAQLYANRHVSKWPAVITGPSRANVRIERLWRDIREKICDVYRALNKRLEEDNLIPIQGALNEEQLFALRYSAMTIIQSDVNTFCVVCAGVCPWPMSEIPKVITLASPFRMFLTPLSLCVWSTPLSST